MRSSSTGVGSEHYVQGDVEAGSNNQPPETSRKCFAERDPEDHISLHAGADVFFVEDDHVFFKVSQNPTVKEIDKSYRHLAISMHPDKNGGSVHAKETFQYLQTRYERFRASIR